MARLVVALCFLAVAASAPLSPDAELRALRTLPALEQEEVHDEYGQYALRYVTAEGTVVAERGRLVPTPDGTSYVMVFEGEVSYIGDDGQTYISKYTAGLDGYHVENIQIPVPVVEEPIEVVEEPVRLVEEPVRMVEEPVRLVQEPVRLVQEPVRLVQEPVRLVQEPVRMIEEPVRFGEKSVKYMAEPYKLVAKRYH